MAVDAAHVYWANLVDGTIGRANLDGTGVNQSFITGAIVPCGVAVDGAHIYWANAGAGDTIGRANLDGTGVDQGFISGASNPCGVAVDGAHVYWANGGNGTIGRANLNGTGVNQSFIAGASGPCGVAVDAVDVGYPRPKGATPIRVSLVPAFDPCIAPNRTHGPPLAFPSCTPPVQASSFLTVGTPDANGAAAQSVASLVFAAVLGDPATAADEADIKLTASATDVRLKAGLGDYTGELDANARRSPHRPRLGTGPERARHRAGLRLPVHGPLPGDGQHDDRLDLRRDNHRGCDRARDREGEGTHDLGGRPGPGPDGGPDGVASTTSGNTLFETQGVFVP